MAVTVAMLTSMLVTAAPALADVSSATVTVGNSTVSASTNYTVIFSITEQLSQWGNITITFPSGTTFEATGTSANVATNVSVAASPGWYGGAWSNGVVTGADATLNTSSRKLMIVLRGATDAIGETSQLRINYRGMINPSTAGSFTLTVVTTNETSAVTSAAYVITLPSIGPLPGQIEGKNSAGDVLYRDITSALATAIGTAGVVRIELGPGTYNATNTASTVNQTIIGVGASGTVILTAPAAGVPLTVSATGVVIDNVVIQGNRDGTADLVDATANATFRNVTFSGGVNQLDITSTTVQAFNVDNCTFSVTGNVSRGINSSSANASQVQLNVTNSTFTVDASGTGIASTSNLTLSNSTFTGSSTSPIGVSTSNGTSTITGNTFTNLTQALRVTGNTSYDFTVQNGTAVNATGNAITGSGATSLSSTGSVYVAGGVLVMVKNTISTTGSYTYALNVAGGNLTARFNSITGNTLNARQTSGTANASHNWWGASTGPSADSINGTVTTTPYLTGAPSGGTVFTSPTANLTAKDTEGVDVSAANGTMNFAIAARYAANPLTAAPPGSPVAYYDVNIGVTPGVEPGAITIRFYASVTATSKVYYGGGLAGGWTEAGSQGVNVGGGYAYITITAISMPNYADMTGTPFVVTNVAPTPGVPTLLGPATGVTGVPTNTGFSWSPVTGATYDFQLSLSPTFATINASVTGLTSNVYGGVALAANTTYFWRVRSILGTVTSAYATSTFTTAAPAAPTTAPVINVAPPTVNVAAPPAPSVTVQAPPPAQVNIAPAAVTIQAPPPAEVTVNIPEQAPLIPQYLLWTILLIGAVLVIALIVLIVRTRRVA